MELKAAGNAMKRGFGFFRAPKDQKNTNKDIWEAIAKASDGRRRRAVVSCTEEDDGNGVIRMKIVVKKSDFKQLLEAMNGGGGDHRSGNGEEPYRPSYSLSVVEQRLIMLRKKHNARPNAVKNSMNNGKCWSPRLQSIPEELSA